MPFWGRIYFKARSGFTWDCAGIGHLEDDNLAAGRERKCRRIQAEQLAAPPNTLLPLRLGVGKPILPTNGPHLLGRFTGEGIAANSARTSGSAESRRCSVSITI